MASGVFAWCNEDCMVGVSAWVSTCGDGANGRRDGTDRSAKVKLELK